MRICFLKITYYIDSELLVKKTSKKLVDVNKIYIEFHTEEGFEEPTSDPYSLLSKVKDHYGSKIQVDQESKKQGISLYFTGCYGQ